MEHPLLQFCTTENQVGAVSLCLVKGLSQRQAANKLGVTRNSVKNAIDQVRQKAARRGYSEEHGWAGTVPPNYMITGTSELKDAEGNTVLTWYKSKADDEARVAALLDAIEQSVSALPKFKPTKAPANTDDNLATLLTITDFHLGMKAWRDSDGDDWDVRIARDVFLNAIHDMVNGSPKSGVGILNQLGDFLHWDGLVQVTPTSGHHLTGDDRYSKLVELTINVMTEAVQIMLKRFGKVVVVQAEGNHDLASSVWMRKFIKHRFEDDPRVEVIDNEFPYYAYQHGQIMLGFHHGHRMRMAQLQKLFASEPRFREMWGQSKHAYIHVGHLHHERVLDDAGATIEQHPTLAARDNYSSSHGYVSQRGAKCITYDKIEGEVSRITVRPRL